MNSTKLISTCNISVSLTVVCRILQEAVRGCQTNKRTHLPIMCVCVCVCVCVCMYVCVRLLQMCSIFVGEGSKLSWEGGWRT